MDGEGNIVDRPHARKKRRWLRILLITVMVLFVALVGIVGGSYLWLNRVVESANNRVPPSVRQQIEQAIQTKPSSPVVSIPAPPTGMDIMVVGDDTRNPAENGQSDTLMLVHVDSDLDYMAVLSIPRDLWVNVPGHGMAKINAAYASGGTALSISTIKELTGIDISRYAEIDTQAFQDLTDTLGGVYVDVDHRYYYGPADAPMIDLQAGYQLLNGKNALDYARFRRDLNSDFGRMARQQRLLMAWRQQAMTWNLPLKLPGIIRAFFNNTRTNLTTHDVLSLGYWLAGLGSGRIKQIELRGKGQMIDGLSVIVVDEQALKEAITDYLTPPDDGSGHETTTPSPAAAGPALASLQMPAVPNSGPWSQLRTQVSFQLEAPAYIPKGYAYQNQTADGPKPYDIKVGDGTEPAVKIVYRYQKTDLYLGITETTWTDAPIASKGTEIKYGGTTFTLVGSGDRIDHIWWRKGSVLYFISNTLFFDVSRVDLLAMAESMVPIPALE